MTRSLNLLACCLTISLTAGCQHESSAPASRGDINRQLAAEAFADFRQAYLLDYWAEHPIEATQAGQIQYASRLPALSDNDIARQIDQIKRHLQWLDSPPESIMTNARLQSALNQLRAHALERLLLLESAQNWRRDPRIYLAEAGFLQLDDPDLGSAAQRAFWLKARLDQLPMLLETGLENLAAPPQRFTIDAIRSSEQLARSLDKLVQRLSRSAPELGEGLYSALVASQRSLQYYRQALKTRILPGSLVSDGVGTVIYERFLQDVHGISIPATEWLRQAEREWRLVNAQHKPDPLARKHSALILLDARIHSGQMSADGARHFLIDELGMSHSATAQEIDNLLQFPARIVGRWSE